MNKEDAIKYLKQLYPNGGHCWLDEQRMEAIGMAIKALQEEPVSEEQVKEDTMTIHKEWFEHCKKCKCEDPIEEFKDFIPFKPWRRKCNALLKQWTNREIRFKKFLRLLEEMTEDISFEVAEKNHRMTFQGTILPAYHKVGNLVGNMLEVDDKKVLIQASRFNAKKCYNYGKVYFWNA